MLSLVTAVIKPHKLAELKEALQAVGVQGITISEVKGFGRQGGHTETYRGAEYSIDFVPKVKVEVLAPDTEVEQITRTIAETAHTGKIGDGKIWVTPVLRAMRIRTGEMGSDAI